MTKVAPSSSNGFTLIELLVSVSIFAVTVTLGLVLFNQILRVQRRTEVSRRVNQAVRNVTEFIVKEVRNGAIDYGIQDGTTLKASYPANCPDPILGGATYDFDDPNRNNGLALVNAAGEQECIYYNPTDRSLYLEKIGLSAAQRLTPADVEVVRFEVRVVPGRDPYMDIPPGSLAEIQPMAQIVMDVGASASSTETKVVNYQTSISTNVYDIPRE